MKQNKHNVHTISVTVNVIYLCRLCSLGFDTQLVKFIRKLQSLLLTCAKWIIILRRIHADKFLIYLANSRDRSFKTRTKTETAKNSGLERTRDLDAVWRTTSMI